jgi:ABC-2 type transport system ATP-binding protein
MDELLQMRGVRKGYGGAYIFQNLDLTVSKGRIVGLIGDNGTGKTTLLRLMAGLIPPDDGEVIRQESILGKSGISYLADSSWFYGWMKVRDAVSFYSNFYQDFDVNKARLLLQESSIEPGKKIRHLSAGEAQRLCMILAVSRKAGLYLMDEPASGMDPAFKKELKHFLLSCLPEGAAVIMATHLLKDLETLFDDVILLKGGEALCLRTEEIREKCHKSVEEYYLEVRNNAGNA